MCNLSHAMQELFFMNATILADQTLTGERESENCGQTSVMATVISMAHITLNF